jgi:hypothetical protein
MAVSSELANSEDQSKVANSDGRLVIERTQEEPSSPQSRLLSSKRKLK